MRRMEGDGRRTFVDFACKGSPRASPALFESGSNCLVNKTCPESTSQPQLYSTTQLFPRSPIHQVLLESRHLRRRRQDADLRQDPHGEDDHPRGGVLRHHRQRQDKNSRQRGVRVPLTFTTSAMAIAYVQHSPRPTTSHLCW